MRVQRRSEENSPFRVPRIWTRFLVTTVAVVGLAVLPVMAQSDQEENLGSEDLVTDELIEQAMQRSFEGVRGGVQYAFYNHNNNNQLAQQINEEAGFPPPTGWTNDGDSFNANVALGSKFADGKGHASVYLDYRKLDELTKGARDYVNCSVSDGPDGPECGGSSTSAQRRFRIYNRDGSLNGDYVLGWESAGSDGHSFVPRNGEVFNYGPYNHFQRPETKYNAGAFANYEINKHFDVYMEVMYMNNYTDAQIAPSGNSTTIS